MSDADTDRQSFIDLHEIDLLALGKKLAAEYHEMFSQQIEAGIQEALAATDWPPDPEDHDILIPALKHRIHQALMRENASAAGGWLSIFWTNLRERYDGGGDV